MKRLHSIRGVRSGLALRLGLVFGLGLTACAGADDSPEDGSATDASTGAGSETENPSTSSTSGPIPTTVTVSGSSSASSTGPDSTTDTGSESGDPDTDSGETGTTTGGESEYGFDESDPDLYAQIDRMGMPAINTAVITSKDLYNRSTPVDDAGAMFVDEIVARLTLLHSVLDDDLTGLGLVPCAIDTCVGQAAPLVVPDTLSIDLTSTPGFPNGRLPTDPVMDVTLAVILLDLSVGGQTATSLVGVNPTENDVEFQSEFPYFAEPHQ